MTAAERFTLVAAVLLTVLWAGYLAALVFGGLGWLVVIGSTLYIIIMAAVGWRTAHDDAGWPADRGGRR